MMGERKVIATTIYHRKLNAQKLMRDTAVSDGARMKATKEIEILEAKIAEVED